MAESYLQAQIDSRTFGAQQARLIDDLNRPDLSNIVTEYLQDAMRFYQRKAFFFNEIDNTAIPGWVASTFYPQGSTILVTISSVQYVFVALQTGIGQSDGSTPAFPATIFTIPATTPPSQPPPPPATPGTIADNTVIWANIGPFTQGVYTQLSTVYNVNQYVPPIDYVSPILVEITWSSNIRQQLLKVSYEELRSYDVIRPSPSYSYSTMWAWFQSQIYLWPYPSGFFPLTLSYRTAPQIVQLAGDSNFWTTTAERLIRKYAQKIIASEVMSDSAMAELAANAEKEELATLRSQQIEQNVNGGIPPSSW
jgi:hypothetical protein